MDLKKLARFVLLFNLFGIMYYSTFFAVVELVPGHKVQGVRLLGAGVEEYSAHSGMIAGVGVLAGLISAFALAALARFRIRLATFLMAIVLVSLMFVVTSSYPSLAFVFGIGLMLLSLFSAFVHPFYCYEDATNDSRRPQSKTKR